MAEITKNGIPSISTVLPDAANRLAGDLFAGEALGACDACYIKTSDGKVYRSDGSAAAAAAKVRGFTAISAKTGQATSLYSQINFAYGTALTPGASYYLSGTILGGLADAASTGGTGEIAFAIDATRIRVRQSTY
jgi:hypothetical protein